MLILLVVLAIFRNNSILQFFSILVVNTFLGLLSVCYFEHHKAIINQPCLIMMLGISVLGYGSLLILDNIIKNICGNEDEKEENTNSLNKKENKMVLIIRRKSFHIAPLLILPICAYLNIELLQIMLCGSFYILFNL